MHGVEIYRHSVNFTIPSMAKASLVKWKNSREMWNESPVETNISTYNSWCVRSIGWRDGADTLNTSRLIDFRRYVYV